jgi:phosphatidyl-myo-inositol alpha-mannosyltransferase
MRILLTNPYCWPYVRRGSERFLAELAHYLAGRGHDVTVLTSKPGPDEIDRSNGVVVVRKSQIQFAPFRWIGITPATTFLARCAQFLQKEKFDVVHCLHYADALGAFIANMPRKTALVAHLVGMPFATWFRRQPWESLILRVAVRRSTRVVVICSAAERSFEEIFRRRAVFLGIPCDISTFALRERRDLECPRILGVADFSQPRKGALVLARGFGIVKKHIPRAILQYCGNMPETTKNEILEALSESARNDVQFLGVGTLAGLPAVYGQAAVTVLPSVHEPFGMVLIESLACGTPVVGSRDAGIPDIVEKGTGVLFDPGGNRHSPANSQGLADAIVEALGLYGDPSLAERCRERARCFSWEELGPKLEDIYREAVAECGVAVP